ncbi:hypothetical protein ACP3V9_24430, partial [Salmonella enterica]|uniref:hypothetical protein n=1 Tax=Salmonella enterica TaxID=28901 RepID=UPI003CE903EF
RRSGRRTLRACPGLGPSAVTVRTDIAPPLREDIAPRPLSQQNTRQPRLLMPSEIERASLG